jgi:hypothetical protein
VDSSAASASIEKDEYERIKKGRARSFFIVVFQLTELLQTLIKTLSNGWLRADYNGVNSEGSG